MDSLVVHADDKVNFKQWFWLRPLHPLNPVCSMLACEKKAHERTKRMDEPSDFKRVTNVDHGGDRGLPSVVVEQFGSEALAVPKSSALCLSTFFVHHPTKNSMPNWNAPASGPCLVSLFDICC